MNEFEWTYQYGDRVIPISAQDIVETLKRAISSHSRAMTESPIAKDVKMKIVYETDIQILMKVRDKFQWAIDEHERKQVHLRVVGRKGRKTIIDKNYKPVAIGYGKEKKDGKDKEPEGE